MSNKTFIACLITGFASLVGSVGGTYGPRLAEVSAQSPANWTSAEKGAYIVKREGNAVWVDCTKVGSVNKRCPTDFPKEAGGCTPFPGGVQVRKCTK